MDLIPISALDSRPSSPEAKSIRGTITLIWPYSSSTRSAAVQLAEPDFRLRRLKGQVRIQLTGAAAESVARSKISSGDVVVLSLRGARWVEATPGLRTPGRSVDLELAFNRRLNCEISRNGQLVQHIKVMDETPPESCEGPASPITPCYHPQVLDSSHLQRDLGLSTPVASAFHRRARVISGELIDSPYDPFAGDDINTAHTRKKQRLSWGGEGRWTVDSNLPSPLKQSSDSNWIGNEDVTTPEQLANGNISSPYIPEEDEKQSLFDLNTRATIHVEQMRMENIQDLISSASGGMKEEHLARFVTDDERSHDSINDDVEAFKDGRDWKSNKLTKFAVFRDQSLPRNIISSSLREMPTNADQNNDFNTRFRQDEQQFFDLPSSDPAETREDGLEIMSQTARLRPLRAEDDSNNNSMSLRSPSSQSKVPEMARPELVSVQILASDATSIDHLDQSSASPKTPNLQPQTVWPLPSPFPSEELPSYVDYNYETLPNAFAPSPVVTSPVLPDYMLQLGFGFGSQGFAWGVPAQQIPESGTLSIISSTAPLHNTSEMDLTEGQIVDIAKDLSLQRGPQQSSHSQAISIESPREKSSSIIGPTGQDDPSPVGNPCYFVEQAQRALTPDIISLSSDHSDSSGDEQDFNPENPEIGLLGGEIIARDESYSSEDDLIRNEWQEESKSDQSTANTPGANINSCSIKDAIILSLDGAMESQTSAIIESHMAPAAARSDELSRDLEHIVADLIDVGEGTAVEHEARSTDALVSSEMRNKERTRSTSVSSTKLEFYDAWQGGPQSPAPFVVSQDHISDSAGLIAEAIVNSVELSNQAFTTISLSTTSSNLAQSDKVQSCPEPKLEQDDLITPSPSLSADKIDDTKSTLGSHSQMLQDHQVLYPRLPSMESDVMVPDGQRTMQSMQSGYSSTIQNGVYATQRGKSPQPDQSSNQVSNQFDLDLQESVSSASLKCMAASSQGELEETGHYSQSVGEPRSDIASSFLSSWFDRKASQRFEGVEDEHTQPEDCSTLKSQTLHGNESQAFTDVSETQAQSPSDLNKSNLVGANKTSSYTQKPKEPDHKISALEFSFSQSQSQATQARGLLTTLSYYTPLNNLYSHIRVPSNSQGFMESGVDTIAVVSKATTKPLRADKGQRDWHTTFSITDSNFWPKSIRVQTFRPWRAALPRAEEGDVVLLRTFEVFSAKGNIGVGLRSGEDAAWCVWHFANIAMPNVFNTIDGGTSPGRIAAAKPWMKPEMQHSLALTEREEVRGPPVEIGNEEREFASNMRDWWVEISGSKEEEAGKTGFGSDQPGESTIEAAA